MKNNYNDIIDIILTFALDKELLDSMVISGSIVPYLVLEKESDEFCNDLYILVEEKKMNFVRRKLKKLSKEYLFDIISDSKVNTNLDHGFKIKYEDTIASFFPYSIVNNNLTIKNYWINKNEKTLNLKTKVIPNIIKSSVIRIINFSDDKNIRIMTPEFILIDKILKQKKSDDSNALTMKFLDEISDESIMDSLKESIKEQKVKIIRKKINNNNLMFLITLFVLLLILLIVTYICFKK